MVSKRIEDAASDVLEQLKKSGIINPNLTLEEIRERAKGIKIPELPEAELADESAEMRNPFIICRRGGCISIDF